MKTEFCKFDARFRRAVLLVAESMGLEFISTRRQVENGTLSFYDPETETRYSLHESGYVRRYIPPTWWPHPEWRGYQLNRINQGFVKRTILADPDAQLGIFVRAVLNYRGEFKLS